MRSVLVLLLVLVVAACQATPPPSPAAPTGITPSSSAGASATPRVTLATGLDPDAAIKAEAAAYPDDYCGLYRDEASGALTSMWTTNGDAHLASITAMSDGSARLAVRSCRFPRTQLEAVQDEIAADIDFWMLSIPARRISGGLDEIHNRVEVTISSGEPDAADRVLTYYTNLFKLPQGILVVDSDGTGAALYGWGAVSITVVGRDGRPARSRDLSFDWVSATKGLECGIGDVGYGVSSDGSPTDLPCQVGTWTIRVVDSYRKPVGSARVTVLAGRRVALTIRLSAVPNPPP